MSAQVTPPPRLSILLLSEDSGRTAEAALREFLTRLFRQIDPYAEITSEHWEPAPSKYRPAVRGNAWKGASRRDLVSLRQYIAAKLVEEGGFVLFHIDGDRAYGDRATSENVAKFEKMIRKPVEIILGGAPNARGIRRSGFTSDASEVEARLEKLIAIVPFYSIESWYFQNTKRARELCKSNPKCRGKCDAKLDHWSRDREELDECIKVKSELCFGSTHNLELARGLPIANVLRVEKSMNDLLLALSRVSAFQAALLSLRPGWARHADRSSSGGRR